MIGNYHCHRTAQTPEAKPQRDLALSAFRPNAAFYSTMLVAFALFEAFKEDVTAPVVPVTAYATTLRRSLIDIAAKLVRSGGKTTLKVAQATCLPCRHRQAWRRLRLANLWRRSGSPPRFAWTT